MGEKKKSDNRQGNRQVSGRRNANRRNPTLQGIQLTNFKGYKNSGFVNLKPLTILVGQNSSGKSSIMKALATFAQTAGMHGIHRRDTRILNARGDLVDIGVFNEVSFNNKDTFSVGFRMGFQNHRLYEDIDSEYIEYTFGAAENNIDCQLRQVEIGDLVDKLQNKQFTKAKPKLVVKRRRNGKKWKITQSSQNKSDKISELDSYMFKFEEIGEKNKESNLDNIKPEDIGIVVHNSLNVEAGFELNNFKELMEKFSKSKKITKIKSRKIRMEKIHEYRSQLIRTNRTYYRHFIAPHTRIQRILNMIMRNLKYIGPLREEPKRQLKLSSINPIDVGKNGENTAALLHNANRSTKDNINAIIEIMGIGSEIGTDELILPSGKSSGMLQLYLKEFNGNKRDLSDVGFGVSQILPVILQCCVSKGELILLEQPELHLHPGLQPFLADPKLSCNCRFICTICCSSSSCW